MRVIAAVSVALIALLPAPGSGQVPPGMKMYYNLKHGFQMQIPQTWKVELLQEDKAKLRDGKLNEYVVMLREPATQAVVFVGENEDAADVAGIAYARRAITEVVISSFRESDLKVTFVWEDKPPFNFPIAHYSLFEVPTDTVGFGDRLVVTFSQGGPVFALVYYLQDDGSGRGLPPRHVTHAALWFMTSKSSYKTFEQTFHHIAGSIRFFNPSR